MKNNVMVLTTGLSGSSLVTGLIARAGYWPGNETAYKDNSTGSYHTFENSRFNELNDRLVELSGRPFDSTSWYDPQLRFHYADLHDKIDLAEFKAFADDCGQHQPWILKDPKLWVTLDFWLKLFDARGIDFVFIRRAPGELWLSQTRKRIIYDYAYLRRSEETAFAMRREYLRGMGREYLELGYEALLRNPADGIGRLNAHLGVALTEEDWKAVFNADKVSGSSLSKWLLGLMIYLKNYPGRITG